MTAGVAVTTGIKHDVKRAVSTSLCLLVVFSFTERQEDVPRSYGNAISAVSLEMIPKGYETLAFVETPWCC